MTNLLHQASCVMLPAGAILIEGLPGSGKSSLALALIDRGGELIGDDGVVLQNRKGRLWASPPPNTAGKLEIRNLGLVDLPVTQGPVILLIRLDPDAPRFIEEAQHSEIAGVSVPAIALFPNTPALPLRAEWAVRKYGLTP
jgi:serine kinase of HPr protein (carbohydrate metabolism regulator)